MLLWGTRVHNPNGISIASAANLQVTVLSACTVRDMSLRIARLPLAHPNRNPCFLGVTRRNNPCGISISSVVFARLAVVSNRQNSLHTDHARYVATGRTVALRACHTAQERGRRICALLTGVDKKLSYRRGTAISPQQVVCIQVIYTSRPWSVCL